MKAMVLQRPGTPLRQMELPTPTPSAGQVLVKVAACGVCRTDLHLVDGGLKEPKLLIIPGHEIVGHVCEPGAGVTHFRIGERVGIPWLGRNCGTCRYCRTGHENLCSWFHRLSARRRLLRLCRCSGRLLLSDSRHRIRRRNSTVAMCRFDRLSIVADRRRGRDDQCRAWIAARGAWSGRGGNSRRSSPGCVARALIGMTLSSCYNPLHFLFEPGNSRDNTVLDWWG